MNITYTGSNQKIKSYVKSRDQKKILIIDTCQERDNQFSPNECFSVCVSAAMFHSRPHVQEYLLNTKHITIIFLCVLFVLLAFASFHLIGFVYLFRFYFFVFIFRERKNTKSDGQNEAEIQKELGEGKEYYYNVFKNFSKN